MAQELVHSGSGAGGRAAQGRHVPWYPSEAGSGDALESPGSLDLSSSRAVLEALGDEPSRRILSSAISHGKAVEEISAEQGLPQSTCYRRVRRLLDEGLMILERMVVTRTGKRYGVYRTSFSTLKISFETGEIRCEVSPNPDILAKLRERWLAAACASQDLGDPFE